MDTHRSKTSDKKNIFQHDASIINYSLRVFINNYIWSKIPYYLERNE
jgi:hypothetical protein